MGLPGNKGLLPEKMDRITNLCKALLFCGLTVANAACAKQTEAEIRAESSYNRLCKIYEEVKSQKPRSGERADMLGARLRIEVPELRVVNSLVVRADPRDVYDLYKQAASDTIGKPWDCHAIKAYYQE